MIYFNLFSILVIIFYVYVEHNQKINHDITSQVGDAGLPVIENKKMLTSHTWRTVGGLALIGIIGALQALHGQAGLSAWIDMVLPLLLLIEHGVAGRTE